MMRYLKIALILFFSLVFFPSISRAESHLVRVAVIKDAAEADLSIRSAYRVLALNTNEELFKGKRLWHTKVSLGEGGINIGEQNFKIYGVRIQPDKSPSIYLNNRRFRGAIDIIRQSNNKLLVVNHLDVEEYICGVLYHEVAPWWPMEALKAQAIVSRTFALHQAKVNAKQDYDLVSTVYSQVYGGRTSERGRTSRAVKYTKNKVLTYSNKLFSSFYHATCAGYTEEAGKLWNINLTPLKGRECQFCRRSPHFHWKKKISLQDIEEALEKAGFKVGLIKSIETVDRDISSRITELEITSTRGRIKVGGNRFRLAVGPNIIKSTNFTVEIKKRQAYFEGYGWGHGVGMCQWGSFFMAREGFNSEQILNYYYPESKIKDFSKDYETF